MHGFFFILGMIFAYFMKLRSSYSYNFSNYLLLVTLAGFVSCMAISYELWLPATAQLPPVPVLSFLDVFPAFVNAALSICLFILLATGIILNKKNRVVLYFILVFTVIAVLFDYARIQPWVFYFWFIVLLVSTKMKDRQLIVLVLYMLAGIYIWSALQKLNFTFFNETFVWINQPIWDAFGYEPESESSVIAAFAVIIEFLAGAGLLMKRTRRLSLITLMLMHAYILIALGPFGRNVNTVIWPWNLAFITILTLILIFEEKAERHRQIIYLPPVWKWLVIIVFVLFPALSFIGWWPQYLSSALYSGNKATATVYMSDSMAAKLSEHTRAGMNPADNSISLNTWSLRELGVPPYPSEKIQQQLFSRICERSGDEQQLLVFEGYSRPDILTGERQKTTLFCEDVMEIQTQN